MRRFSSRPLADEEGYSRESCWISKNYYDIKISKHQTISQEKTNIFNKKYYQKRKNDNRVIRISFEVKMVAVESYTGNKLSPEGPSIAVKCFDSGT